MASVHRHPERSPLKQASFGSGWSPLEQASLRTTDQGAAVLTTQQPHNWGPGRLQNVDWDNVSFRYDREAKPVKSRHSGWLKTWANVDTGWHAGTDVNLWVPLCPWCGIHGWGLMTTFSLEERKPWLTHWRMETPGWILLRVIVLGGGRGSLQFAVYCGKTCFLNNHLHPRYLVCRKVDLEFKGRKGSQVS